MYPPDKKNKEMFALSQKFDHTVSQKAKFWQKKNFHVYIYRLSISDNMFAFWLLGWKNVAIRKGKIIPYRNPVNLQIHYDCKKKIPNAIF